MAHSHGVIECEHPTKKVCESARREALGRCSELTQADKTGATTCTNWAIERVNDRPVCGVHYATSLERDRKAEAHATKRARIDKAIQDFLDTEPERQAETIEWWEANATAGMKTAHVLAIMRRDLRIVETVS